MVDIVLSEQKFDEEKFKAFCGKYGFNFPKAHIEFLKKYNDSELESNIITAAEELGIYIRYFYGTTNESYSDIKNVYEQYADRMPLKCVPIADCDFGNQICISLNSESYGKIYFWDHETMDADCGEKCKLNFDDMIFLADSFESLLDKIIPFDTETIIEKKESVFEKIKKMFKK